MGQPKRRHNKSFREQACKLVTEQNYSVREAAQELGIAKGTLWDWLTDQGRRPLRRQKQLHELGDDPKVLRIRIQELEGRVQQLELEKQILKKATAFFAREQHT